MSNKYSNIQTEAELDAAIREVSKAAKDSKKIVAREHREIKQNLTPLSLVSGLVKKGVGSFNWFDLGLTAARILTRRLPRK